MPMFSLLLCYGGKICILGIIDNKVELLRAKASLFVIKYFWAKIYHFLIRNLKNNQLTGPIPSTLSQIQNLKTLDLARNKLIGEVPRLLYWNEVLQYLGLRGNMLTGILSPDICQLFGLCDVRDNNLTGTIPESIGNCTSFEIFDISYNQITGEIPYNIGFLQVATLSLQGNRLTGKIPEVIGLMQALAILQVDLSENQLVGPIPPILGNLSFTGKLYLHGNMLTGSIPPELGNMSKLSYLTAKEQSPVTYAIAAEETEYVHVSDCPVFVISGSYEGISVKDMWHEVKQVMASFSIHYVIMIHFLILHY